MILVIGGRSKIGLALLEQLSERAVPVRALVRSGESGELQAGVDAVRGDLADPDSLTSAMTGVERVSYVAASDSDVRGALSGLGINAWMVSGLVELFRDYRRSDQEGYAAQITEAIPRRTGRPARSLDQLLAEQPVALT